MSRNPTIVSYLIPVPCWGQSYVTLGLHTRVDPNRFRADFGVYTCGRQSYVTLPPTRVDPHNHPVGHFGGLHVWTPKLLNSAPHTFRPPTPLQNHPVGHSGGLHVWTPKLRNVVCTPPTDVCRPQRAMPATVGAPTRVSTTQGFDYLNPPALRSSTQSIHNWHFEIRIRLSRSRGTRDATRPLPALGPAPRPPRRSGT